MPISNRSHSIDSRVIRVFVSSTFADMQEERDELVKFVFPELRKFCESRHVTWGEVDLRWGVTDEQKAEGKVLPICLEEIKRCRPYFIGILGERYGWIPDEIPPELIESEPWLLQHKHHSVTELEILHGVLNNPDMANHAFFYFRDPKYADSLPPDKRKHFRESDTDGRVQERQVKLAELKQRIRESDFPVKEDYSNPKTFGQLVLQDFKNLIERLYPETEIPDPLDREAADHEAFAESRRKVYIGGEKYYAQLDAHADGDGLPLVVLGESGSGKSALLANWVARYRERHPDTLIIQHYIGSSTYSTDWAAMLRRIIGECKRRFGMEAEIPSKPEELRAFLANFLHMVAVKGRVLLILDALNQLEDRDQAPDLVWLPPVIPANIRLIVSSLPGRSLDDLTKRAWPTTIVEPLEADERLELIDEHLRQYTKALSGGRAKRIVDALQTANPLYMRVLLEELRVFGKHERLDEHIDYYLQAQTIPELYSKVLKRWEKDYGGGTTLVQDAMSLLWAARRGLSEAELLDMLGKDGQPLPRAVWSPLYLAASDSLVSKSGLLGLFHDYLRDAIQKSFVPKEADQRQARMRIADYFQTRDNDVRKIDELPWQLAESKEWKRLYDVISDLPFLETAWNVSKWDVRIYWAKVENNSDLRKVVAYKPILDSLDVQESRVGTLFRRFVHFHQKAYDPEFPDRRIWVLATLFADCGNLRESLVLREHLTRYYQMSGNIVNLAASLNNQAIILYNHGDLKGAMALYKRHERLFRELENKDELQRSLGNQALIHTVRGDLDRAMALFKKQAHFCRELENHHDLQVCLGNQAGIFKERGDLDGAMTLNKEKERLCRRTGNKDGLAASLHNQALLLKIRGDLDRALILYKESECFFREAGNKNGLQASLGNQGIILFTRGDLDGAMILFRRQEHLCRELGNKNDLQRCLGNQVAFYQTQGDLDRAIELLEEQECLCKETGNKKGLVINMLNHAKILAEKNRNRDALDLTMKAHKEAIRNGFVLLSRDIKAFHSYMNNRSSLS